MPGRNRSGLQPDDNCRPKRTMRYWKGESGSVDIYQ